MSTETLDDVLEHYGIKGMRWGVRRSKKEIASDNQSRLEEGKKVTPSKDAKAAAKAAKKAEKKGVDALSNDELKMLNERLGLEKRYESLTFEPEPAPEISRGRKIAVGLMGEAGKLGANVARQEAQRMLAEQVRKQIIGK